MKRFNNSNITLLVLAFLLMMVLSTKRANADFFFGEPVKFNSHVSGYDELCCFSYDGLEMYISAMGGEGDYDLWVLKRASADEDWGPRENLGPAVNSPQGDYYASISADGLELYFASWREGTSSDWTNNDDLYVTKRPTKNDPWGQAMNLGPTVNRSGVQERSPWISLDGLELYFMSYRSGGYGGTDIWVTRRTTENDPWGEPANLGPIVNSSYYESYLSLSPDGLLLLFNESYTAGRPRRPGGYGASDMWMTRRTSLSDPWKEPINLGPKINSPSGDFLPRISMDGRMIYFGSDRTGWENWQAPIIPIVDFNGDGVVDITDVSILTNHWGEEYSLCDIGPMPWGDRVVDVEDLKVLAEHLFEEVNDPTLIAHWALDETDGMFATDSVSVNSAFIVGGASWQPNSGQVGGALQLNGIDGCAIAGTVLNPADGPFSVFAWIRGGAPGQVVLSQTGGVNWLMADPLEGKLMTELSCPPGGRTPPPSLVSEYIITDGEWHHIGFVWDGAKRILYADNIAVAEDTQDGLEGSDSGLYIGTGKAMEPGTYWSGLIDDVRIYNRLVGQ